MAFGITMSLATQTLMNLAVVTGVMPVTGITLPLVSYGGSSLVITLLEIGVLLNISRYAQVEGPRLRQAPNSSVEG
jgi:cell division protein FtsW